MGGSPGVVLTCMTVRALLTAPVTYPTRWQIRNRGKQVTAVAKCAHAPRQYLTVLVFVEIQELREERRLRRRCLRGVIRGLDEHGPHLS